jgi:hypothetical protein
MLAAETDAEIVYLPCGAGLPRGEQAEEPQGKSRRGHHSRRERNKE